MRPVRVWFSNRKSGASKDATSGFFASTRFLIAARGASVFLQFLSLPILARLLSFDDFAIMALGMVVVVFANIVSDAGIGRSLVRVGKIDPDEWSTVFWFLTFVGILISGCLAFVAPLYAGFMDEPRLTGVIVCLALLPFLQALTSVPQASIEWGNRFGLISILIVLSGLVSAIVAVVMAFMGAGYWALVAQQVALLGTKAIGSWYLSGFVPRMVLRTSLLKPHVRFGRDTLLFSFVMTLDKQIPVVAFGQMFGNTAVSLWAMTERVARLPRLAIAGPLSQVAMVLMSRQYHNGAGDTDVGRSYIASTRLLATLIIPPFAILAAAGLPVFVVLLSEDWAPVSVIFGLAVPALIVEALISPGGRVFMVMNRTGMRLRMSVERFAIGTVLFLAALPFGLEAAIIVRSLFAVAYLLRYWTFINRCVPVRLMQEVRTLIIPTIVGVAVCLIHLIWIAPEIQSQVLLAAIVIAEMLAAVLITAALTSRALKFDVAWLQRPVPTVA